VMGLIDALWTKIVVFAVALPVLVENEMMPVCRPAPRYPFVGASRKWARDLALLSDFKRGPALMVRAPH